MREQITKEVPFPGLLGIFVKYQLIDYSGASYNENKRISGRTSVQESLNKDGKFTFSGHYVRKELTGLGKATLISLVSAMIGISYLEMIK